ncbi:MAG: leucine-rich repeat domain-containing protein [Aureispira sp.]
MRSLPLISVIILLTTFWACEPVVNKVEIKEIQNTSSTPRAVYTYTNIGHALNERKNVKILELDQDTKIDSLIALPQLQELRISLMPDDHIPSKLPKLSLLKKLAVNIYTNTPKSKSILASIDQLSQLEELQLIFYPLVLPTEPFRKFKQLRTLSLSFITSPIPNAIYSISSLKELHLNGDFSELSEELGQLIHLERLHIDAKGPLQYLPTTIGKLQQLHSFHASQQNLHELPVSFQQLQHLEYLNLKDNPFDHFPLAITALVHLQDLDLQNCPLTSIPASIGQLQQLKHLYLTNTNLTRLPNGFEQLKALKKLRLNENKFLEFPTALIALTHLKQLYIGKNQLQELPASIASLTALNTLVINDNHLQKLPQEIAQLTQLENLNLSGNPIANFPIEILPLSQLKLLDLSNCQLKKIPQEIDQLYNLNYLNITGNHLHQAQIDHIKTLLPHCFIKN